MTARDHEILNFLSSYHELDRARLETARKRIDELKESLASAKSPRFNDLVTRRILASTSLSRKLEDREEWDRANAFIATSLAENRKFDILALKALNAILTRGAAEFRSIAVFAGQDEYLTASAIPESLAIFESFNVEADSLLRAALLYIFVINVHPFANGNGRSARLAADWILLDHEYLPLCFPSSIQSHVAYAQNGHYPSLESCVLKCYAAIINSYSIVLGDSC